MCAISSRRSAYESFSKCDGGGTPDQERLLLFVSVPELFRGIAPPSASVVQPTFAYSSTTSKSPSPVATSGVAVAMESPASATDDEGINRSSLLLLLLAHKHKAARRKTRLDIQNYGCNGNSLSDHCVVQETAFPLWRATEKRRERNAVSLVSSVIVVIRLPISCMSLVAIITTTTIIIIFKPTRTKPQAGKLG